MTEPRPKRLEGVRESISRALGLMTSMRGVSWNWVSPWFRRKRVEAGTKQRRRKEGARAHEPPSPSALPPFLRCCRQQVRNVPPASHQFQISFVISHFAKDLVGSIFSLPRFLAHVSLDASSASSNSPANLPISFTELSAFMQFHPYFASRASIPPSSFLDALLIRIAALFASYGALNTQ